MFNFFIFLSKYFVILACLGYITISFFAAIMKKEIFNPDDYEEEYSEEDIRKFNIKLSKQYDDGQKNLSLIQFCLILLINIVCFGVLFLKDGNAELIIFMSLQILFFILVKFLYPFVYNGLSYQLMNHCMMLMTFGLVMICRLKYSEAIKQFIFIVATMIICLVVPEVINQFKKPEKLSYIYAAISFSMIGIVLIFGQRVYGSKNWIRIGGTLIQPSEFAKIVFVFAIAAFLSKGAELKKILLTALVAGAHVLVLVAEKDLGGALVFFVTYIVMIVVASGNLLYLAFGAGGGAFASILGYKLFSHVRIRVQAWKDPWSCIDNNGYQMAQSLFAIGTGGWFGLGLTRGYPESIPVASSDFIFASICEEMGTITGICIILIYITTFITIMKIAVRLRTEFHKLLAVGLGFMITFQTFLCIGGVTKFIPSTGVTLPLVSYGGSSIVSTLVLFNIIQGLYVLDKRKERQKYSPKKKKMKKMEVIEDGESNTTQEKEED